MKFTKELVDSYADKLLIGLTSEENKMVLDEFEQIDKDIDIINRIPNIEKIEPMSWCLDNSEVMINDDEIEESPKIDDLLKNADDVMGREVQVIKVVG